MADQKIEKCPFCEAECSIEETFGRRQFLRCTDGFCGYESQLQDTEAEAIAAHNKVSRNNAAAPDLLTGCKLLIAWGEVVREQCGIIPWPDGIENIRADIAKAEGE